MPRKRKELLVSFDTAPTGEKQEVTPVGGEAPEAQAADAAAKTPKAAARRKPAKAAQAEPLDADEAVTALQAEPAAEALVAAAAEPVAAPARETADAPLLSRLEVGLRKKDRNETHDKDRVYIRKDLKVRLDAVAESRSKGFKTLLLNYGLEKALEELEQANADKTEHEG